VVRNSVDSETMDFVLFLVGSLDFWIFSMVYSGKSGFQAILSTSKFQGLVAFWHG
jgi:hypothetical protein